MFGIKESTILKRSSDWLTLDESLTSAKRKRRLLLSKTVKEVDVITNYIGQQNQ